MCLAKVLRHLLSARIASWDTHFCKNDVYENIKAYSC